MGVNSCGTTLIDQGLFENIGAITWDTTVKTSGFTAVSGNGYFCNTTSAAFTVTLPSSPSAGDVVAIADYANTFDTNNVTIGRNGSNIQGEAKDFKASIEGLSITLIYVDGTQGWLSIDAAQASNISNPQFVTATGGTITTSGDFKIHSFTGPGTFCVSNAGNACGSDTVEYLVVAGGGGGGADIGAGAGAGGYIEGCVSSSETAYSITVGAGGTGGPSVTNGSNSVFSSFTAIAGGAGGGYEGAGGQWEGNPGGSGGGAGGGYSTVKPGGLGTSGQGFAGSVNTTGGGPSAGGSGGGAGAVGTISPNGETGDGGIGKASSITGSSVYYAGGGGGGQRRVSTARAGGNGGGGNGASSTLNSTAGTANIGGGGGGGSSGPRAGAAGGSGIVIIRYKFQ